MNWRFYACGIASTFFMIMAFIMHDDQHRWWLAVFLALYFQLECATRGLEQITHGLHLINENIKKIGRINDNAKSN